MLNNIYLIIVFTCFLSSLNVFRLDMSRTYKYFSFFILFVFITETAAVAWPRIVKYYHIDYSAENHWIYNLYLLPAYLFYLYFFYHNLKSVKAKRIIKVFAPVYLIFGLVNMTFLQGLFTFNTYTVLLSGAVMVCLALVCFYEILNNKIIVPLKTNPFFWISSGAFVFHLTTMLGLFFILFLNNWYGRAAVVTSLIIKFSSIIMYTAYLTAFLCRKKGS